MAAVTAPDVSEKAGARLPILRGPLARLMDQEERRTLAILTEITRDTGVSQRGLASRVGIALGLINLYLKRLARKGYIKARAVPPNRFRYYLTPKGFVEKTRLTYAYMEESLRLYRETRRALKGVLEPWVRQGGWRLILYGTGEAAEIAYLTLRELGLELGGVVADDGTGGHFLGLPVGSLSDISPEGSEVVLVASFRGVEGMADSLRRLGIPRDRILVPVPGRR